MTDLDLIVELDAAQRALMDEDRAMLRALGIPDLMVTLGFVGSACIELDTVGCRYQPVEDGNGAFVTPVRVGEHPNTPESVDFDVVPWFGDTLDLCAWHPDYPTRWATRRGLVPWLGAIAPQLVTPAVVPIRCSPLSWLRASATGLCLLPDDPLDAYRVLTVCRKVQAENDAHAQELRRLRNRPFKRPTITVARPADGGQHVGL